MMDFDVHWRRETAGFTLVEMLVVLAVVAAATGVSFLGVRAIRAVNSPDAFAHRIGESLVALRYRALNTGRAQSARFDVQRKRMVAAVGGSEVILPAEYSLVVTAGKEAVERDLGSSITFLPDGSSSGVEISISDLRGNDAKLRVNWLTGLVDYAPHD
ncbi:general secretion pathway protein H [Sinorhizobium fredii USDA 205]|uniref:Prepilin-type N-terminal cleavage/methylation domain-containing protein n=3 Tax=Rhizobium fredii TaxID=380 RepID=A0A844AHA8_RHIFR|nr:prepilin-type N-terminal cleavage/methylation domain-containing protein [Sinorhizobium fredii]ASY70272.1 General secretion pathway protein H [Sinorhizobium fredii CCBAU 83666]KSV87538.1 general secretion pathway protein H [Sinorhizobium fredii USDA 205]MQW93586.1 prepilin-type N-terminal cleavage/methylation domain-containing protein [Sinorhizobium fredii]MQX11225.1 prepilin-type N-terminal cleavage/methylation domain-containing protein [Sinorhizobium fredii]UTY50386.1 prepilin-type N-termi